MSSYSESLTAEQAIGLLNGRFQLDLMLKLSKLDILGLGLRLEEEEEVWFRRRRGAIVAKS